MNTFRYKDKNWQIIKDSNIKPKDHCEYCDFKDLCESYIDNINWFACGCTFNADIYYIKEIK